MRQWKFARLRGRANRGWETSPPDPVAAGPSGVGAEEAAEQEAGAGAGAVVAAEWAEEEARAVVAAEWVAPAVNRPNKPLR